MRYLRVSPQKARLVVDLVRGKQVEQALSILRFSRKAVARDLYKVLWSAIANAKEREGLRDESGLFVQLAYVDGGPTLKRIRANSMGRAFRILHRTSHVTFVLGKREVKSATAAARGAGGSAKKTKPAGANQPAAKK
jgi:large subunit ribosomal protein L22